MGEKLRICWKIPGDAGKLEGLGQNLRVWPKIGGFVLKSEELKGKLGMHWKTSGVAGKLRALLENLRDFLLENPGVCPKI